MIAYTYNVFKRYFENQHKKKQKIRYITKKISKMCKVNTAKPICYFKHTYETFNNGYVKQSVFALNTVSCV